MDFHTLLSLWILTIVGLCSCQNELLLDGPLNGAVGGSVVFTLITPLSAPPSKISWISPSRIEIFISLGDTEVIHPDYTGRISVNKDTASLALRILTLNDTGEYILRINIGGVEQEGKTSLTVFEKISNVRAEADQNKLVEFNNSVTLTCSASGTSPSFRWFNRSTIVTGSDKVLLDKNSLTILNVTRHDDGPFQCEASNSISDHMSSNQVNLTIYSGPDSAVITVPSGALNYSSGSDITLSCSSESNPAAQFRWALNGALLDREGSELRLENIQTNQSGAYSCWAHNIKTLRYKTSLPQSITVIEKIFNVRAEADQNELVEFNNSVTLTCSASGTSPLFQWFNGSDKVTGSDRVQLDKGNLNILNVTRYDNGLFKCEASNPISVEMSSDVSLTIYSGPDSAVVKVPPGDPNYSSGSDITLSCSSESNPAAQVQWALNGTLLGREGPELRLENVQTNQSGAYSCWAHNNKTLRFKTSLPQSITVIEIQPDPPSVLSIGAIAGIVIGVIIILAAVSGVTFYFIKKKGKTGAPKPHQARGNNGSVELNYADISHFQRKTVKTVDQGNGGNGETLYSGVRLPSSPAGPNSGQGPTNADLNFPRNAVGMRANSGNAGDQNTVYAQVRP